MNFPRKFIWTFLSAMLFLSFIMGIVGAIRQSPGVVFIALFSCFLLLIIGTLTPAPPNNGN